MKRILILTAALTAGSSNWADGLKQELVPANARWVLHLDAEAFRKSRIGAMIVEDKAESKLRQVEQDAKIDLDFSFNKITAITAFGPTVGDQKDGVMLVQTKADVRGDLEKLIGFKEQNGGNEPQVSRITANGVEIYKIGEELNLMQARPGSWLLGKSRESVQAAREVAIGKEAALKNAPFASYPAMTNGFFFLAFADTGTAGSKLPAQAQILQKAEGGRLAIGEQADKLLINVALRVKDAKTISEMQQLAQGLVAFVKLAQADNKDLMALVSGANVTTNESFVGVDLSFPLDRAMKKARGND
jgi:hypothetical protein